MARLTRIQQQARTRASVLAAAREEFAEHGYAPAKIDRIAERAELTRGAVYSNFPSKRALYLAVLQQTVQETDPADPPNAPASMADALGAFARVWLERLPLFGDPLAGGRLHLRSLVGVLDDEGSRAVLAQAVHLEALLLALGLESCESVESVKPGELIKDRSRRVRLAELTLTLLGGSGMLSELVPGFGDPFDQAHACQHLALIDLREEWAPAHLPYVARAEPCQDEWAPPAGLVDLLTGERVDVGADGLVVMLGARCLAAAEEAVRSAGPGEQVTVVVVTGDPAETGGLVRLRLSDLAGCLRRVFPPAAWRRFRLVLDDDALVAPAMGLQHVGNDTQSAVRIRAGSIVARASGRGAGHAAALAGASELPPKAEPAKGAEV